MKMKRNKILNHNKTQLLWFNAFVSLLLALDIKLKALQTYKEDMK